MGRSAQQQQQQHGGQQQQEPGPGPGQQEGGEATGASRQPPSLRPEGPGLQDALCGGPAASHCPTPPVELKAVAVWQPLAAPPPQ